VPTDRIIIKARLTPVIGQRFQPTGFPGLGPAEFSSSTGTLSLLVESPQSMANRLEEVIWNRAQEDLVEPLRGMPYVRLRHPKHGLVTSITEAHRIASTYLLPLLKDRLIQELGWDQKRFLHAHELAPVLLRRDPNSLIHGVYFSTLKPGNLRLPRMISAFIEATDVSPALSGGVKLDHLDCEGPSSQVKGHIPYERREYVSPAITASFSVDLAQLRRYALSPEAETFLRNLALYKVGLFLEHGLRLRTACDLTVAGPLQVEPALPDLEQLAHDLAEGIARLQKSGEFPEPGVWDL
jgi:CRISPR-associated protein Csb1